ncbi:CheR family methyltransferase [Iodobacter sp. CM08]|uniref:CheR family methyltransferase n=1 Tax=Iodobacter sp. CM08 TaxID=3085902 RepID=UPI0029819179|nr:CheR family methyltransferase [Iodobacter sp. CM08]MDW5418188.1 CheR family methyltransferase [Iodobacter sp. CM08]
MQAAWFDDLTRLVLSRTGIVVREQDNLCKEIESISRKQLGLSPVELLAELQHSKTASSRAWREVLAFLTVGESYFFRDEGQFKLLSEHILPELLAQNGNRLRIWSAACSSGEEAYSIAILISQLLPTLAIGQRPDIQIIASDVNQLVLEKAKQGIYSEWSFRRVDPAIRSMYFTKQIDGWKINQNIQQMVQFYYGNLQEDLFPAPSTPFHDFDLIICRNVFIYFQAETVSQISSKFVACLKAPGYLITGHGELGLQGAKGLDIISIDNLLVYKKNILMPPTPVLQQINLKPQALPPALPQKKQAQLKPNAPVPVFNDLLQQAKKHANNGQYELATKNSHEAIKLNPDSPQPHFVLAQIAEVLGNRAESKTILKKALYLDHTFLPAYVELFNIYMHEDNKKMAEKMLASALDIVRLLPGHTPVTLYDETSASELLLILEQFQTSL